MMVSPVKIPAAWTQPIVRRQEVDLRLVPLGFLGLIVIGALLLRLPWTHRAGQSIGWLDAFFLSTSATCVTGLTTVNVAGTFNRFGQGVLLGLIQLGGLGIFTAGILLVLLSGQRLSLADEHVIRATVGKIRRVRPLVVFLYGCVFILLFELAGTVTLFLQINAAAPKQPVWQNLWDAAFHAVSAFCNAGLSTYPDNLEHWRYRPGILAVVSVLIIAGGIGLMTLINLRYYYFWRRDPRRRGYLTLQAKLSLFMAAILLLAGTAVTWIFERRHTLAGATLTEQITWSFFHSATCRTAGFNVVDPGAMNPPTLLFTMLLMFIGGAPGSMAGGIKTVTFAVLVRTAWSALRRRENIEVFGRRISPQVAGRAVMMVLIASGVLMAGVGLLMFTEQQHPAAETPEHWLAVVFEAVSAFGTVGLSAGVTPLLTAPGKLIIILLMFAGRIIPLMLSVYLARPSYPWHVRAPSEEIGLG
jgi:trk system potassium uptake protein TrkH